MLRRPVLPDSTADSRPLSAHAAAELGNAIASLRAALDLMPLVVADGERERLRWLARDAARAAEQWTRVLAGSVENAPKRGSGTTDLAVAALDVVALRGPAGLRVRIAPGLAVAGNPGTVRALLDDLIAAVLALRADREPAALRARAVDDRVALMARIPVSLASVETIAEIAAGGLPTTLRAAAIPPEAWRLALAARRARALDGHFRVYADGTAAMLVVVALPRLRATPPRTDVSRD